MKLSVIIPVYNTEKYLKKCLDSLVNQTYKNIEIVIINDGSPDNSDKIIKKYKKEYPKIINYITQDNHGQSYARNVGIEKSTGDLITFVDSDDYIENNMYNDMIDILKREKTDLVICDMSLEQKGKKTIMSNTDFKSLFECPVSVCNKIMKRELIKDLKFIEGVWYEDYNFFTKVCLRNPSYSLCKKPLYNYQIHDNSTMNNNNSLKNLDIITATEDIIKQGIDKDLKESLIIEHIVLDSINRIAKHKNKDKKYALKEMHKYIKKNIKNIFKTKIYKNTSLKRKIIIVLNYYNLWSLSKLILSLKGALFK